ncbi:MAG: 50S ribosomal protein L17 [Spirochaetes bacterium]|nr:50S ribosomal protein L17 [Spirochaetota bacterium]
MNHLKGFNKLNITHSHRKALYKNMLTALFKNERIKTTLAKAKEIRRIAEKIITKAKNKNLHNIRNINKLIKDKEILMKLFNEIALRYIDKNGGYTRIIKLFKRVGDGADMAYLELISEGTIVRKKKKKKIEESKDKKNDDKSVKEISKDSEKQKDDVKTESKTEIKKDVKKEDKKVVKKETKKDLNKSDIETVDKKEENKEKKIDPGKKVDIKETKKTK